MGKGGHRKVEEAVDGFEEERFFVKSSFCIYRTADSTEIIRTPSYSPPR